MLPACVTLLILHTDGGLASGGTQAGGVSSPGMLLVTMVEGKKPGEPCTTYYGICSGGDIISTHIYRSVNKRLLEASQMAILDFKWAERHDLIMFWREEREKYLINSTEYLPQVLHKPDTVMDAMNTKMNTVCPRPRKIKFWGNSFI